MDTLPDSEIINRVLEGDVDRFRLLVDRHSRAIFRLAWRMTGNEHDAEDVVQETFIRAYRQLARFELRANFGTWIHRIAVNCALDQIKARTRRGRGVDSRDPDDDVVESLASMEPAQDRLLASREARLAVRSAMERLSPNERTAFVLRHFEGMSIEEIGSTLGTRVNATKNTIFRAVQKLRSELEPLVRSMP